MKRHGIRGLANLMRLSAYWLRLGIELERIRPAHPEENGQHERMHRTLKFETTRPPRTNLLQQQERFDEFVEEFNNERPHEALAMKRPAQVYKPSPRDLPLDGAGVSDGRGSRGSRRPMAGELRKARPRPPRQHRFQPALSSSAHRLHSEHT